MIMGSMPLGRDIRKFNELTNLLQVHKVRKIAYATLDIADTDLPFPAVREPLLTLGSN